MPLGIITKMVLGATRLFYKGGTSTNYKSGTGISCKGGTSVVYKDRTPAVCSLLFLLLFSQYMYHTHLENIQIFVILTFTKFFRFMIQ